MTWSTQYMSQLNYHCVEEHTVSALSEFCLALYKSEAIYARVSKHLTLFIFFGFQSLESAGEDMEINWTTHWYVDGMSRLWTHFSIYHSIFFCGLPINDCNAWRAVGMCSYKHSNNVDMSCFWNFTSKILFLSTALELKWIGKVINLNFHPTIRQRFLSLALRVSTRSVLWSIDCLLNWYVSYNFIPFSSLFICEISAKMNLKHVKLNNLKSMETPSLKLWLF